MKKLICLTAVLLMSAPVFADPNITITVSRVSFGPSTAVVDIGYSNAEVAPVGISMTVDMTIDAVGPPGRGQGEIAAAGDVGNPDSFFDVFIDYAADDPNAYAAAADPCTGAMPGSHPVAKTDQAGTPTFPVSVFSLCMGELANVATVPLSGPLARLTITKTAGVGASGWMGAGFSMTIGPDNLRGGIVDADGNPFNVAWPATYHVPFECEIPPYCNGDLTRDTRVRLNDYGILCDIFDQQGTNVNSEMLWYNDCGDFNGDLRNRLNDYGEICDLFDQYGTNIPCSSL